MNFFVRLSFISLVLGVSSIVSNGEVVRVEVTERSAFADGISFGPAGAYERILGRGAFANLCVTKAVCFIVFHCVSLCFIVFHYVSLCFSLLSPFF